MWAGLENEFAKGSVNGEWGGFCTCPDGQVYGVADNNDACGSLACVGGTPGVCEEKAGVWSKNSVVCAAPQGKLCEFDLFVTDNTRHDVELETVSTTGGSDPTSAAAISSRTTIVRAAHDSSNHSVR